MVSKLVVISCLVALVSSQDSEAERKPLYQYRYETEDLKTAASGLPMHGYHVVEGGYYPEPRFGHFGAGFQRPIQPFGFGYNGGNGLRQPLFNPSGYAGVVHPHLHAGGGEVSDRIAFQDGSQGKKDASFNNVHSTSSAEGTADQAGFKRDEAQISNGHGDTASYQATQAQKQASEDGKNYEGAQHFAQQGQNAGAQNQQQGHKKGHIVKGFKTSHHKDETGHTEEYYDESNDEGGHFASKGNSGSFGEQAKNAYKGGHDAGHFDAGESNKHGHFQNIHHVDNANTEKGDYAQKQTFGQGRTFGVNNGVDQHSILGHQESNHLFKHHPTYSPFYKAF